MDEAAPRQWCPWLKILDPEDIDRLSVKAHGDQPDLNQTNRGTVYTISAGCGSSLGYRSTGDKPQSDRAAEFR